MNSWLAMEDLQAGAHTTNGDSRPGLSGAPFAEDVLKLKKLLVELDPESSALR